MNGENKKKTKMNLKNIEYYKCKMKEIDILADYISDPEIFDVGSMKCKLFLIKIFTVLNPNFHYLSLINKDSIGQELLKAACIFQLYPFDNTQKGNEIFQNLNDVEIHKFWTRFLNLCKMYSKLPGRDEEDSFINEGFRSKYRNINTILQYVNYDISIVNVKDLKETDVEEEITSWMGIPPQADMNRSISDSAEDLVEESIWRDHSSSDVDNLVGDICFIKSKIELKNNDISKPIYQYSDFFNSFNQVVMKVMNFKNNFNLIHSFILNYISKNNTVFRGRDMLLNNNQFQRCNDIINSIILKRQKCFKLA